MDKQAWHILLIEDNAEDCADMRQMLLRGGTRRYRFSEAGFGAEGVRLLLSGELGSVDCVLLDYALPDMDALEVLAALCQGGSIPPCPVVVITGAAVEEGQRLLSAGAQDFIGKRWTGADSLTRAVENAVDRHALQVERQRVEDALRQSEERYRALFNSIDVGYAVVEVMPGDGARAVDVRYLQVNPAFARQTGLVDAAGRTLRELVPGIEPLWFEVFAAVALTGEPVRLEQHSAAMKRWFDVYAFRLGPPDARQVALLFNDCTERKLGERALLAAKAQAESANRAKSDFLLHMSHELRSPLSSILGFAQLIEGGQPPPAPAQRDSVEQILQAGWYLLGLINEILDLTAIESGKTAVCSRALSVAELLGSCQALISPQAERRGIRISFPQVEPSCLVQADPVRTKQVLINLLTNAIKYNRAAGQVTVRCTSPPGGRVRIDVEDTGLGLSEAALAQLFEPFNRLGQELGAEPGTGIGLVICKRLVEQMGGRLGAASTVGVGSSFWFELDRASEPAAPPRPAGAAIGQLRTVLCIEDTAVRLQQIEALVTTTSRTCLLHARDIPSGMAIARSARPDVILVNPQLRDPTGLDARALLARDPVTAHIPVIALGAEAPRHGEPAALPAGFAGQLPHPLLQETFNAVLDSACQRPPSDGLRATA